MTVQANESGSKKKKGLLSGLLGGGKSIWLLAIAMALVAVAGTLSILGNAAATQTYYVLTRHVPARTQIDPTMLAPMEAKVGQVPPNAYDPAYVRDNPTFAQFALMAGDVVSASNAGPLTRITANVPDNFVAASFPASPDLAVAGKVRAGDFIDLIGTMDEGGGGTTAKVVLQHVLVLDVTVSPSNIAVEAVEGQEGSNVGSPGPESEAVRSGIPSLYTVAVTPEDAAKLALLRSQDIFVVLSANLPEMETTAGARLADLYSDTAGDSAAGTFGSIFIKRWDHAFEPGNVFVDDRGNVWKVAEGVWTETRTGTVLEAGDLPPGYLPVPEGTEFLDAEGIYWVVVKGLWTAPENNEELSEGDNPTGYDPRWEFPDAAAAATATVTPPPAPAPAPTTDPSVDPAAGN